MMVWLPARRRWRWIFLTVCAFLGAAAAWYVWARLGQDQSFVVLPIVAGVLALAGEIALWMSSTANAQEAAARRIASALDGHAREEEQRTRAAIAELARHRGVTDEDLQTEIDRAASQVLLSGRSQLEIHRQLEAVVNDYHQDGLRQSRLWFAASLVAASVGFVWLLVFAVTAIAQADWTSTLRGLPGVVVEAMSALFFQQASASRRRATELLDRARSDTSLRQAMALVNSIENPTLRDQTRAQIAVEVSRVETPRLWATKGADTAADVLVARTSRKPERQAGRGRTQV
jgi:hypothetical protein